MRISIINGPNLNLLGTREPHIYGHQTFEQFLDILQGEFPQCQLGYFQSNHEGELIDQLHQAHFDRVPVVLNAGGLSHTSVSLADAVAAISVPVIEVHISNVFARESYRHHSYITGKAKGLVTGLGLAGYRYAILHLLSMQPL